MEAVAAHALGGEFAWQGELLSQSGLASVQRRIEAGYLRDFRQHGANGTGY